MRTMLVTGAASGIGRAIALHFARAGWRLGLADRDGAGLAALAAALGSAHLALPLDVRDGAAWTAAIARLGAASGGRLDVFVNNAGIAHSGRFEDIPLDAALAIVETNLAGAVRGIYACLPLLKATPGARLVTMGSSSGLVGYPAMAVYSATKAGLMALSEALAVELADHGIAVTTLAPHFIDTPLLDSPFHRRDPHRAPPTRAAQLALVKRYGPDRVVAALARAIDGGRPRILVGGEALWIDALRRLAPGLLRLLVRRRWRALMEL
jgi:NAD(P)-dependent dehydrogenase (short-subunit alcohol dehydrogenase family)